MQSFIYLVQGGAVNETPDIMSSVEIARRTRACWMRINQAVYTHVSSSTRTESSSAFPQDPKMVKKGRARQSRP